MIVTTKSEVLKRYLEKARQESKSIGFVPTMGALHQGHISLITESKKSSDITLSSLFVNPTQFNNPDDLKKYPRTTEKDIDMLESAGCDILFLPAVEEIYPPEFKPGHYDIGKLDSILEGSYRPGHFQGVCMVVDRLLSFCEPDILFLGQKDYQQCMVIRRMIELKNYKTSITVCPTIREKDGLAMSSRNMRLTAEQREQAVQIYKSLVFIKQNMKPGNLNSLLQDAVKQLQEKGFSVEYVQIADANDLSLVENWDGEKRLVALAAAYLGEIRLIDNLQLF